MELVLMRHGQTDFNVAHLYTGHIDAHLNVTGRAQAHAAGCVPDAATVYTSNLSRARDTARICFPNAQQIVRPDLAEMDFGVFQGKSAHDMEFDPAYRAWVDSFCTLPCPGGESQGAFIERVAAAVADAVREQLAVGARRTIIVAHGGTITAALYALACPAEARGYFDRHPANCGGYHADVRFARPTEPAHRGDDRARASGPANPAANDRNALRSYGLELCNIASFSNLRFLENESGND